MRLVHIGLGEIDIVRRDQRDIHGIGHFNQTAFGLFFRFGQPVFTGMALQFHIQAITKDRLEARHQLFCSRTPALHQQLANRPFRTTRQTDQARAVLFKLVQRDMGKFPIRAQIQARIQLHQVFITGLVLGQQNDASGIARTFALFRRDKAQIHLTADDRLNARARSRHRKLQRREQVIGVRHRNGGHLHRLAETGQFLKPHGPLKQRVFRVHAQMNESGISHDATLCCGEGGGKSLIDPEARQNECLKNRQKFLTARKCAKIFLAKPEVPLLA